MAKKKKKEKGESGGERVEESEGKKLKGKSLVRTKEQGAERSARASWWAGCRGGPGYSANKTWKT